MKVHALRLVPGSNESRAFQALARASWARSSACVGSLQRLSGRRRAGEGLQPTSSSRNVSSHRRRRRRRAGLPARLLHPSVWGRSFVSTITWLPSGFGFHWSAALALAVRGPPRWPRRLTCVRPPAPGTTGSRRERFRSTTSSYIWRRRRPIGSCGDERGSTRASHLGLPLEA